MPGSHICLFADKVSCWCCVVGDFWSSCLHCPRIGITGVNHHTWIMPCHRSKPGFQLVGSNRAHPQLDKKGLKIYCFFFFFLKWYTVFDSAMLCSYYRLRHFPSAQGDHYGVWIFLQKRDSKARPKFQPFSEARRVEATGKDNIKGLLSLALCNGLNPLMLPFFSSHCTLKTPVTWPKRAQ